MPYQLGSVQSLSVLSDPGRCGGWSSWVCRRRRRGGSPAMLSRSRMKCSNSAEALKFIPSLFHLAHFAKTAGCSPSSVRSTCVLRRVRVAHSMHRVHPHSSQNVLVCRVFLLECQHKVHVAPYCRPSKVRFPSPGGNSAITCLQPSMRSCA